MQALALSKAPVIASHSAARALADHSRNMDDEQLEALKKNGGVIQTVAFASYVKIDKPDSPERAAAIAALRKEFGLPAPGRRAAGPAGGGGGGGGGAEPRSRPSSARSTTRAWPRSTRRRRAIRARPWRTSSITSTTS